MDESEREALDFLNEYWEDIFIINNQKITPLADFLGQCLGEHGGGILFIGCGKEEGNRFVLKLDLDGHFYKRISDTGDNEKDWEWIGDIEE